MPGAFLPSDPERLADAPVRTSGNAVGALVAGVTSFLCLFGVGGALAILLGWLAHGEIERSNGRVGGKALATGGIALGALNLVGTVVLIGVTIAYAVRPGPPSAGPPLRAPVASPLAIPSPPPTLPHSTGSARGLAKPGAAVAHELPQMPAQVGKVPIVDARGAEALDTVLREQLREAGKSGQQLVLWTVAPDCQPCADVGRALPDARMQRALANVRLVRTDVTAFGPELERLGIPLEKIPGFTLIDSGVRPLDHIHGGEWDADIPANIAPVLDKFLHRLLKTRRDPWSRPLRDGETTL